MQRLPLGVRLPSSRPVRRSITQQDHTCGSTETAASSIMRRILRRHKKLFKVLFFIVVILVLTPVFIVLDASSNRSLEAAVNQAEPPVPRAVIGGYDSPFSGLSYTEALRRVASPDKVVVFALVDWGFIDMALNFHESSLLPFGIDNFLFLSSDQQSCSLLAKMHIACYVYVHDTAGGEASEYHSTAFLRKMNYRTEMIIRALEAGFTVLHTDVDIMFLQDPLQHIHCGEGCDVVSLWDATKYNAGFIYLRPTKYSLYLYKKMQALSGTTPSLDDQIQLREALKLMAEEHIHINISRLPEPHFQCGRCYFEDAEGGGPRTFAGDSPCPDCVVVHNNWIVTKEAKRYRAREHHHWMHDWAGYYSNPSARYLTYSNPLHGCTISWPEADDLSHQIAALKNALAYAHTLNRILILPAFMCRGKPCALNSIFKISDFDKAFDMKYREHSFLQHPKVPSNVKEGLTKQPYYIWNQGGDVAVAKNCMESLKSTCTIVDAPPQGVVVGLNDVQIKDIFGNAKEPVLVFHSMYDTFSGFVTKNEQLLFDETIARSLVRTDYRQQKPPHKVSMVEKR